MPEKIDAGDKLERSLAPSVDTSIVAEIDVRRELAAEGWLTVNMNTEKANFPNVDLLAVKGDVVHHIQVKSTNGEKGSHKDCMYLGHGANWLSHSQKPFFNSKPGPIMCSVVVLVHVRRERSRFVVLPVGLAEKIARVWVEDWYEHPLRNGGQRKSGFDARPRFISLRKGVDPLPNEVAAMNTLHAYEDRWDVLSEKHAKLRELGEWDLVQEELFEGRDGGERQGAEQASIQSAKAQAATPARRLVEAFGDCSGLEAMYAENVSWRLNYSLEPNISGPHTGKAAVCAFNHAVFDKFYEPGSVTVEVLDEIGNEASSVVRFNFRAMSRSGSPYAVEYVLFAKTTDGKIHEVVELLDTYASTEQHQGIAVGVPPPTD